MTSNETWNTAQSIYEFSVKDIDGNEVSLDKYKGQVLLMVNGACRCGFTDRNYTQLQELYEKYQSKGLRIAIFPSNQFLSQEPWPEDEIKKFLQEKYSITFDLFSKIDVNGENAHVLYKYLKSKKGGTLTDAIKWNFTKFLINKTGQPVYRYAPTTDPNAIEEEIMKQLAEKI